MNSQGAIPEDQFDPDSGGRRPGKGEKKKVRPFKRTSTTSIMETFYPPIKWIVPGYVAEGLAILAGRQKLGKTWLAMDWSIAVACGGAAMGSIICEAGDVLYIDMENGHRRIQRRIDVLFPSGNRPDLSRLEWATEAPSLNDGFMPALEQWRQSVESPRLVVVDVLQRVKPIGKGNQTSYESDYVALADLQQWATAQGVGVICLHHTRKGGADDPLEALSGSNGLSACADTTLVLDRDTNGITLYCRGRDVEELETALKFTDGLWSIMGEASDVRRSDERVTIAVTLEQAPEPMSPIEIADVTGMKSGNVRKLLFHMAKAGEVQKCGRGRYVHPSRAAENPAA